MCLLNLFKKRPVLTIPHPEEQKDDNQTIGNVSISFIVSKWLIDWKVPGGFWFYWQNKIQITVKPNLQVTVNGILTNVPACAYEVDGVRHLDIRPEWLNAGVLAHEVCHCSYALLSDIEKVAFEDAYAAVQSDPYIVLLHKINTYMNQLDNNGRHVEGHAEIGRYIGFEKMPEILKKYYPKLL